MKRKPQIKPATSIDGEIWSHRSRRTPAEISVVGYPQVVHRNPAQRMLNHDAFVQQRIQIGYDLSLNIASNLGEARRIRDAWIAAVASAEGSLTCKPGCKWCDGHPIPERVQAG